MYTANRRTEIAYLYITSRQTETPRQTYVTKEEGLWEYRLCACDIFAEYFKAPRKEYCTEIQYVAGERDSVDGERDKLTREIDRVAGERDSVENNRDKITREIDKVAGERDSVHGKRDKITRYIDRVAGERDFVDGERDKIAGESKTKRKLRAKGS
jgi:hypothetical protein